MRMRLTWATVMVFMLILQIAIFGIAIKPAFGANSIIFFDDFNRTDPAPWFQVNAGPGTISIENGELSIVTDSSGYNVYAVRTVQLVTDFEASARAKVTSDSSSVTNFGINVGHSTDPSQFVGEIESSIPDHVLFFYDGFFNQWVVVFGISEVHRFNTTPLAKDVFVDMKITKLGENWEFVGNNQHIATLQIGL